MSTLSMGMCVGVDGVFMVDYSNNFHESALSTDIPTVAPPSSTPTAALVTCHRVHQSVTSRAKPESSSPQIQPAAAATHSAERHQRRRWPGEGLFWLKFFFLGGGLLFYVSVRVLIRSLTFKMCCALFVCSPVFSPHSEERLWMKRF